VHGIGEHGGRYVHVGEFFAGKGLRVESADLRGHGQSQGSRGHIDRWSQYRGDLAMLIGCVRRDCPTLPIFLYGHSLGGLICLEYCLHSHALVAGLICSSPAIGDVGIPAVLWNIARLLGRIAPRFRMKTRLDMDGLSRDPSIAAAMREDPLSHTLGSVRLGTEVESAVARVWRNAGNLRVPFLLLLGGADHLVFPQRSREYFGRVPDGRKELHEYPGAYHELHNDIIRQQVLEDVYQWIDRQIQIGRSVRPAQ